MRLDKLLGHTTDLTRSQAKKAIKTGLVTVNDSEINDPRTPIAKTDCVKLDGEQLATPQPRYFMLHKPQGYICATEDGEHPTVLDLLDEPNKKQLHIAGRLDIDTTGLVLITDDGQWSHRVTSPRKQCGKVYYATLLKDVPEKTVELFERGLMLNGEKKRTQPAKLELIYTNEVRLTITEGRYHQVKRMFAALDNHVESLHRESIGAIQLDDSLIEGEYRSLTMEEVNSV